MRGYISAVPPTTVFLVAAVSTVIEPVTLPELGFAAAISTLHLRRLALCDREQGTHDGND